MKRYQNISFHISENFKYHNTIAIFNFIGTIIAESDIKEIITKNKIKYKFNNIEEKLKSINENGSIIIFQSFNKYNYSNVEEIFNIFIKEIDLPILAFFTTDSNGFAKPFTNIFRIIYLIYKKKSTNIKKIINKKASIVVGHEAGRFDKKKNKYIDLSCNDRLFALNAGIKFYTPEYYFMDSDNITTWKNKNNINKEIEILKCQKTEPNIIIQIIDLLYSFISTDKYAVILTGANSCGKTRFVNLFQLEWEKLQISKMKVLEFKKRSIKNDLDDLEKVLQNNDSAIVEILFNFSKILSIVEKCMENKTPILILEIKYDENIEILLNYYHTQKVPETKCLTKKQRGYFKQMRKSNDLEEKFKEIDCIKYLKISPKISNLDQFYF